MIKENQITSEVVTNVSSFNFLDRYEYISIQNLSGDNIYFKFGKSKKINNLLMLKNNETYFCKTRHICDLINKRGKIRLRLNTTKLELDKCYQFKIHKNETILRVLEVG